MARGIDKVIRAWGHGSRAAAGNVSCNNTGIFSYAEKIAVEHEGTVYVLAAGLHSVTTSRHCNAVASAYPACVRVDKLPA